MWPFFHQGPINLRCISVNLIMLPCCQLLRTALFLILCLLSLKSVAQTNFEPALIINHSGDTISGFIDNRDSKRNPRTIACRGKDGVVINYSPADIKGFYLNSGSGWYKSSILEIDKNSLDTRDVLQGTNQRGTVSDTVFLRVLIKGRICLYYLNDEYQQNHYVIEKDNKIEELRLEKRSVNSDSGPGVIVVEHYKAQLNTKFADSPNEKISSDQVRYNEASLMKVVLKYNQSFELQKDSYVLASEKMMFRFSVVAGMNASFLKIRGDGYLYGQGEYNPDLSFYGGGGLEITLPKNRQVWSISNDMIYRYYSIEDKFKASQLKMFTTIRYNFRSQNPFRFFLGAGLSNAFGITGESLPEGSMAYYRKYEQGSVFELGSTGSRINYTLRFEMANGFCRYEGTSTKFSNFYFGMGFRI